MTNDLIEDLKKRMNAGIEALHRDFKTLRANRASVDLLDSVKVEAYGNDKMPLNQVASVSVIDSRTLGIQVWDRSQVKPVEKAISDSGLGLSPVVEGCNMRICLPELSEERRKELLKVATKYAETARVSIRNVRRDGLDTLKRKAKEMPEDENKRVSTQIQKLTDDFIKQIDDNLIAKEKDLMKI